MDSALEADDMTAWAEVDYNFHRLLVELCGNRHLSDVARNFLDKAHRFRLLTLTRREKPVYSNVNYAAVVDAIRRGDPQSALALMAKLKINRHRVSGAVNILNRDRASANHSAVHLQQLTIYKSASFRTKKPDQGGNVIRGSKTANGCLLE